MKANVRKNNVDIVKKNALPLNGYDLRLSIGLIVKNEEKTLDKCLQSLLPLLEAIPSELIITDTGSTDRTLEIARKYTTHIIPFEWCGDFSAARNTGVEASRGEWFMFLDADEYFEDTTELIEFFLSGECDKFSSASYIVRSYHDWEGNNYHDFYAPRLFRNYPGMHFTGIIHEGIVRMNPCKFFEAFVHHYGYAHQNRKSLLNKFQRNSELLKKDLEENPFDLKNYFQLAQEYLVIQDYGQTIKTVETGLTVEKNHPNKIWCIPLFRILIKVNYIQNNHETVIQLCDKFFSSEPKDEIPFLDLLYMELHSSFISKKFEKVILTGERYLKLYRKKDAKKLDMTYLMITTYDFIKPNDKFSVLCFMAQSYVELNDRESTLSYLELLDLTLPQSGEKIFSLYSMAADHFEDFTLFSKLFKRVLELNDKDSIDLFITCMEAFIDSHSTEYAELNQSIIDAGSTYSYSSLCSLRLCEKEDRETITLEILNRLSSAEETLNFHFSDLLYYAMKMKADIKPYLSCFDTDDLPAAAANIQKQHNDFSQIVLDYFEYYSYENPRELDFSICMFERVILVNAKDKNNNNNMMLWEKHSSLTQRYLTAVYNNNILQNNLELLPKVLRFRYWMLAAFAAKKSNDDAAYLHNLNLALKFCPLMKDPIKLLLNQYQQESQRKSTEFSALANIMKQQVRDLLSRGLKAEAGQIVSQLNELMPEDEEIQQFDKIINS